MAIAQSTAAPAAESKQSLWSRAFGVLQDEGAVELRRRLIYVTDIEGLKRAAAYGDA